MIRAADLVKYARNAVGGGYCFGADGQVCSLAVRRDLTSRTSDQDIIDLLLGICAQWDGRRVWDCSGLFRGAWRELASYKSGGATTIFKDWCFETGTIDTMPDETGITVFRDDKGTKEHVGLYVGSGMVVHAWMSSKGVVLQPMVEYKNWTHWGRLKDVAYDGETVEIPVLYTAIVKTRTGGGVGLWADNTKRIKYSQIPDGTRVNVVSAPDTHGFVAVQIGLIGYVDSQYLIKVDTPGTEPVTNIAVHLPPEVVEQVQRAFAEALAEARGQ